MFYKTLFAAVVAAVTVQAASAFSGTATYYTPDGATGACGQPIQNTDNAVALSADQYSNGANCGRQITVNYQGKSVTATVVDSCPGCASGIIDLTSGAFQQLASLDAGRIPVTWDFQ